MHLSDQLSNKDKECVCKITFRDGVEVCFLAHGSQQWQGAGVHPDLGVTVIFPGVILDHVEQTPDQVEYTVLWVILQTQTRSIYVTILMALGCAIRGKQIFLFVSKLNKLCYRDNEKRSQEVVDIVQQEALWRAKLPLHADGARNLW